MEELGSWKSTVLEIEIPAIEWYKINGHLIESRTDRCKEPVVWRNHQNSHLQVGGTSFFTVPFSCGLGCRRHCEMHICKVIETASISEHLSHFLRSNIGLELITLKEKEQSARVTFILKARFLKL